uniref:Uncharacterized protein n=1 Tax=Rhizophora mucronata TaxID=61149 RepID=A0A2P2QG13_RHIMU
MMNRNDQSLECQQLVSLHVIEACLSCSISFSFSLSCVHEFLLSSGVFTVVHYHLYHSCFLRN